MYSSDYSRLADKGLDKNYSKTFSPGVIIMIIAFSYLHYKLVSKLLFILVSTLTTSINLKLSHFGRAFLMRLLLNDRVSELSPAFQFFFKLSLFEGNFGKPKDVEVRYSTFQTNNMHRV